MTAVARGGQEVPGEIRLRGGRLRLWSPLFAKAHADRLLERLWHTTQWSQHHVRIAGRRLPCPRLSAWYGVDGARYAYSGQTYAPLPPTAVLEEVRADIERVVGRRFNSVLLNAYRNGADSMGWHSDDEPELGEDPVIASVSLGEARRFRMRPRSRAVHPIAIDLEHGSLLVMDGATQSHWRHAVPKTSRAVGLRLNLTFRWIETASRQGSL